MSGVINSTGQARSVDGNVGFTPGFSLADFCTSNLKKEPNGKGSETRPRDRDAYYLPL